MMADPNEQTLHEMAKIIATRDVTRVMFEFRWDSHGYNCPVLYVRSVWTGKGRNDEVGTLVDLPMAFLDPTVTRADVVRRELISHTISMRDYDYKHQVFVWPEPPEDEKNPSDNAIRMLIETYKHCRKWAHAGEVGTNAVTLIAALEELLRRRQED